MNSNTGLKIENELLQLSQDLRYVLTTTVGTLPLTKDFGTNIFESIDKPITESFKLDLLSQIYEAIDAFMPQLKVKSINLKTKGGKVILMLEHVFRNSTEKLELEL